MSTHIVKPGENLTTIARKYGLTNWNVIYNSVANKDFRRRRPNPSLIFPGDKLEIPDKAAPTTVASPEFSFTIVDSASGKPFSSMTVKLRLPDASEQDFLTDKDGSVTVTALSNRSLTSTDRFDLIELFEGTTSPPVDYTRFARFGIGVNTSFVLHIPNERTVADAIATKLSITRRAKWGKMTPNFAGMDSDWDYEIVTLHHSGNTGESDPVKIEEKHMTGKGWQDVGYHYIIQPSGDIVEGRHLAFKGSHVDGANTGKIGILITGDFEPSTFNPFSTTPTAAQMKSAKALIDELKAAFRTVTKIGGHKDYKKTTVCPGDELYKLIPGLRTSTSLGGP
jgi:N-acetylmuramoyl-L-alanine amidase-like protein/LysM domain-containing protein